MKGADADHVEHVDRDGGAQGQRACELGGGFDLLSLAGVRYERLIPMTPGIRILTTALLLAPIALAQQVADPANLMRERVSAPAPADDLAINHGAAALQQLMLKLRTRASLMMIVAHPDDEDGGMLTYESRGVGARVAMLTLTRGEGGQNLMSADFNDALGLIRTQELLAADRYMGVDQMFGTEVDFGFSKTKEETLAQWTYQRVLYDAVRAVRLYRPLVFDERVCGRRDGRARTSPGLGARSTRRSSTRPPIRRSFPKWDCQCGPP